MDINQLISLDFQTLLLKGGIVVFSILYVIYSIILLKQTRVMIATVEDVNGGMFLLISFIQLIVSIGLLVVAVILM